MEAPRRHGPRRAVKRYLQELIGYEGEKMLDKLFLIAMGAPIPIHGVVGANGTVDLERVPSLELQAKTAWGLYERVCGKTPESIQITTETRPSLDLSRFTAEELRFLISVRDRVAAPGLPDPAGVTEDGEEVE